MTTHADVVAQYDPDTYITERFAYDTEPNGRTTQDFEFETDAELSFESWSFNLVGVFRHVPTGLLFLGHDSGCSCPSPWEDFTVSRLSPLESKQQWYDYAAAVVKDFDDYERGEEPDDRGRVVDQLERVRKRIESLLETPQEDAE